MFYRLRLIFIFPVLAVAFLFSLSSVQLRAADMDCLTYEPCEDAQLLNMVDSIFAKAKDRFGKPRYPVRNIWIFRSVPRKKPAFLCRAEISDWSYLAHMCIPDSGGMRLTTSPRLAKGREGVWNKLPFKTRQIIRSIARGDKPTAAQQLNIVDAFNRLIENEDLSAALGISGAKKKRGGFFSRFRRSSGQSDNRALLVELFNPVILKEQRMAKVVRGMACCEMVDSHRGDYSIYLQADPKGDVFFLELSHEIAHVINPYFYDWYVEGANNLFAEHMARKFGRSWSPWQNLFAAGREDNPYALGYYMMKEIEPVVGVSGMRSFLSCNRPWGSDKKLRFDADRWLATFNAPQRREITRIINTYRSGFNSRKAKAYAFVPPSSR